MKHDLRIKGEKLSDIPVSYKDSVDYGPDK